MANKKTIGLPDHLAPLLQPTPTGVAKLVAAWDGLSTESQLLVLTELHRAHVSSYRYKKVWIKALDSANAYVRYLAARSALHSVHDDNEEKTIKQRIEKDPAPLVRYCLLESKGNFLDNDMKDADTFWALPHEARLAKVRLLTMGGEIVANLISHAVDHQLKEGKVSEDELYEILADYVSKTEFKSYYYRDTSYDLYTDYSDGVDIEALWRLVLKLPNHIAHVLINNLPPDAGLSHSIPEDVLKGMTDSQLEILFWRSDIELREFRKGIFFKADKKRDGVKSAAISYNFDLDYAEFAALLAKREKEKIEILRNLAITANDLSLCLHEAVGDVLSLSKGYEYSKFAKNALIQRLKRLNELEREREERLRELRLYRSESARHALLSRMLWLNNWESEEQLRELRLYRLARMAVPWEKGDKGNLPSNELELLSKLIIKGDTWGTFMAFSKAWNKDMQCIDNLDKYLPRIEEAGESYSDPDIYKVEDLEDFVRLKAQLNKKLSTILSTLRTNSEEKEIKIGEVFSELAVYTTQFLEKIQQTVDSLKSDLQAQIRQAQVLFVVIALLVLLLLNMSLRQ